MSKHDTQHDDTLPLTDADQAFVATLAAAYQPDERHPARDLAFDRALAARLEGRPRRAWARWPVGLTLAAAAAVLVWVVAPRPASTPTPDPGAVGGALAVGTPPTAPPAAAQGDLEATSDPVLALLTPTDADVDDDALYPDDYLALADVLALN